MHHLWRHVLGTVADGVDDHAATDRTVRTRRSRFVGTCDLQCAKLGVGGLQVEAKYSCCCTTHCCNFEEISTRSVHPDPRSGPLERTRPLLLIASEASCQSKKRCTPATGAIFFDALVLRGVSKFLILPGTKIHGCENSNRVTFAAHPVNIPHLSGLKWQKMGDSRIPPGLLDVSLKDVPARCRAFRQSHRCTSAW